MTEKNTLVKKNNDAFRRFMGNYGIGAVLLIMMIGIGIMEPRFATKVNFINVAAQVSINGMIAYGMCLAITTGGIDLSVGAQLALTSCVLGQTITNMNMNIWLACFIALLVSTAFGCLNGILIAKFNMFPFVVTLSTQLIIRGLSQVISSGKAISLTSDAFKGIYSNKLFGIPVPIVMLFVVTIIVYLLMHWTVLDRKSHV